MPPGARVLLISKDPGLSAGPYHEEVGTMVGQTVSHYQILKCLGAGGTGSVCRAEDTILKSQVAPKSLPRHASFHSRARERFIHKNRVALAHNHPNICTVHEIAETEKGQLFPGISCYQGETLRARLHQRLLTIEKSVGIATQLCESLGAAPSYTVIDGKYALRVCITNHRSTMADFGTLVREGVRLGKNLEVSQESSP